MVLKQSDTTDLKNEFLINDNTLSIVILLLKMSKNVCFKEGIKTNFPDRGQCYFVYFRILAVSQGYLHFQWLFHHILFDYI